MSKIPSKTVAVLNQRLDSVKEEVVKVETLLKKAAKGTLTENDIDSLLLKQSILEDTGKNWINLDALEKTLS